MSGNITLPDIHEVLNTLQTCKSLQELQEVYDRYMGKKGQITSIAKSIATASLEEKRRMGSRLTDAKSRIMQTYQNQYHTLQIQEINKKLEKDIIDYSLIPDVWHSGHDSLLTKTRHEIEDLCVRMGFVVEHGTEIVTVFENFTSLNIPPTHPATEMHDTLYITQKDNANNNLLLRTHMSALQNSLLRKYGVPIKVVMPGKVYRNENTDTSHDTTFYQLDGLIIDNNISLGNMIYTLQTIVRHLLHENVQIRIRPAYFPFVEPGIEIDARYPTKDEQGNIQRSKRLEIVGAGMVHPHVLEQANIDHNLHQGFAFGFGINRLVAIRYGIQDIRYFTNGDLRFVRSFV